MNTTTLLLAVIAVLLMIILYLQLRLSSASPHTVIVTPPVVERQVVGSVPFALIVIFLTIIVGIALQL